MNKEALESVVQQLIDEEALGVCFELHRAIKLGYYELLYPKESSFERHEVVDAPGYDVFGNTLQAFRKPVECVCPSCQRTLGASKFAPHLEKCLGMGRSSSRLAASKKPLPNSGNNNTTPTASTALPTTESESDDNEEEWTFPERRAKKMKKDKVLLAPPPAGKKVAKQAQKDAYNSGSNNGSQPPSNGGYTSSSGDGFYSLKPSLQQHNAASFSALPTEYKHHLLQNICGVISERTGRLCTRTIKCPQHSEGDRKEVRHRLLEDSKPVEVISHRLSLDEDHDEKHTSIKSRKRAKDGSRKHKKQYSGLDY